ncbi:NAD(P)/FAD-dependent oxidoreductase [Sphingobium sp.]|uniref:NAD(P)/FAD-dependent oxidoreductase n=1 Tax=Sphingobium sp. TaxID=1912891 RepID=UPI003BB5DC8A
MSGAGEVHHVPALIVGGGPAGAAAAIMLARAGMKPVVVDRSVGPHTCVCGSFMGWDALASLRELGIDAFALGARPITLLRVVANGQQVELPLPHGAAGLSRAVLDAALIEAAADAGAMLMRGRSVRAVDPVDRSIRFDDGARMAGDALFLATGKYDLRGLSRQDSAGREPPSVGLRALLPPACARQPDLAGTIELHLFDHGYAGLLLQEDGAVNLCLSVSRHRLAAAGGMAGLIDEIMRQAPALADRMGRVRPDHFDAVAGVPYGWRAQAVGPGIFRVGDQGAVISSLAGDGIAIALASGISAARAMLTSGPDAAPDWQRAMRRGSRRPLGVADALRHGTSGPVGRAILMGLLNIAPGLGVYASLLTRIGGRI